MLMGIKPTMVYIKQKGYIALLKNEGKSIKFNGNIKNRGEKNEKNSINSR